MKRLGPPCPQDHNPRGAAGPSCHAASCMQHPEIMLGWEMGTATWRCRGLPCAQAMRAPWLCTAWSMGPSGRRSGCWTCGPPATASCTRYFGGCGRRVWRPSALAWTTGPSRVPTPTVCCRPCRPPATSGEAHHHKAGCRCRPGGGPSRCNVARPAAFIRGGGLSADRQPPPPRKWANGRPVAAAAQKVGNC